MADFQIAMKRVARWEGGYQAHKSDKGNYNSRGELVGTNWGVAAFVYEAWIKRPPSAEDMKNMKKEEAWQIFQTNFWDNMLGNAIEDQNIGNILFDGYVNHGRTGLRIMQRVLGLKVDGVVGELTIAAINKANAKTLFLTYQQARVDFYKQIVRNKPSQQVFLEGWLRRIYSFKYEVDSNPK
ncbi:MAG: hypothetical protein EBR82_17535 [Caulobacteraceae bacterium]|nr:hypothetical protein [Caulobacteraceae bacterium]